LLLGATRFSFFAFQSGVVLRVFSDSAGAQDDEEPDTDETSDTSADTLESQYITNPFWVSVLDLQNREPLCLGSGDPYKVGVAAPDSYGNPIQDPWTGYLMSPTSDFGAVITAAQDFNVTYSSLFADDPAAAMATLASTLGSNFLWGGAFDYQRQGTIGVFYGEYRDVSNLQIGVFTYYSGVPKELVLGLYGAATLVGSSNRALDQDYFLPARNREMFELGYFLSEQGYIGSGQEPSRPPNQPDWTRVEYLRVP
jgi:hypothetical protein